MHIIVHRINTIKELKKIPLKYGVEIDIRETNGKLILNHEPFGSGDLLANYLQQYSKDGHKGTIIFNIKEAGIEAEVISLAKKYSIRNYFLLDVEFPYIYRATRSGVRNIAIRYSEDEPIQAAMKYRNKLDWVWIDTNTKLPVTKSIMKKLLGFKTCLVSPDRWGRPEDIGPYRKKMKALGFTPTAVMTAFETISEWERKDL